MTLGEIVLREADKAFPCTCGDAFVAATASHHNSCPILPEAQFNKVREACLAVAKAVVEEARKIARGFAEQGDWDKDTALGIEGTIDEELAASPAKEGR